MRIKYTAFRFEPLIMNEDTYNLIKNRDYNSYIDEIIREVKQKKNDFIKDSGKLFHCFILSSWIIFYTLLIGSLLLMFIIENSNYIIQINFLEKPFIVCYIIVLIGFLAGFSHISSYLSFTKYLFQLKRWHKKLKCKIDNSDNYLDYKKKVNYIGSNFNYFEDGGFIPDR